MNTKNRFDELIRHFANGNKAAFARMISVGPTVIENIVGARGGYHSFEVLQKILFTFANLSPEWLLIGKGNMLREVSVDKPPAPLDDTPEQSPAVAIYEKIIADQASTIAALNREIGAKEQAHALTRQQLLLFQEKAAALEQEVEDCKKNFAQLRAAHESNTVDVELYAPPTPPQYQPALAAAEPQALYGTQKKRAHAP
jgi:uncharacterized coiled-coil protein SlyX